MRIYDYRAMREEAAEAGWDPPEQTWDGQPLYSGETQRELHAIAGQAHAIQHASGIIAEFRNPRSVSSNAQVEGETDSALAAWEGEGGAIL